jgi:hypothetical protein
MQAGHSVHSCNLSYLGRSLVQGQPGQRWSQNMGGGVAQMVEYLPTKCETLKL